MKINIEFFRDDFIKAIGAGVYEITVSIGKKFKSLYIGESVFVLVRCAAHLYELKKSPEYFGFTPSTINDPNITIAFRLLENNDSKSYRKSEEIKLIHSKKPLSQSDISDRQKNIEDKINALTDFLKDSSK